MFDLTGVALRADAIHARKCAAATRRERGPITRTTHYALGAAAFNAAMREEAM